MITYYTDGSASPNPGPGGFAVIKNGEPHIIGGEPGSETTNIRMEGLAIQAALGDAAGEECQIYSDSEFWINVLTKWAPGWSANGWKKKGGEIKNLDIVRELYPLYTESKATLTWVRGHEGDEGNELADEWANKAREKKLDQAETIEQVELSLAEIIHTHFRAGRTMQLATIRDGAPRVCSVYFVPSSDDMAVYWLSEPIRRHSDDIVKNAAVAGAVAVQTVQPVMGLQFSGLASIVSNPDEIKKVVGEYAAKYDGQGADFYERFMAGTNKHQLYKMDIAVLETFDMVHFPGQPPVSAL